MSATPGTNPFYVDGVRWVTIVDPATGLPITSFGGSAGTSPGAPTQVATASGANGISRSPVTVNNASTQVAASNTTARIVAIAHAGGTNPVYLAINRAATTNDIPLYPGGLFETSVPITGAINGITSTGSEVVTVTDYL